MNLVQLIVNSVLTWICVLLVGQVGKWILLDSVLSLLCLLLLCHKLISIIGSMLPVNTLLISYSIKKIMTICWLTDCILIELVLTDAPLWKKILYNIVTMLNINWLKISLKKFISQVNMSKISWTQMIQPKWYILLLWCLLNIMTSTKIMFL